MESKAMSEDKWFLRERPEYLAVVVLTRRDDLIVTRRPSAGGGVDILVTMPRRGADTGRIFGVEVEGVMSARDFHRLESQAEEYRFVGKEFAVPEDIPFPLLLLVFEMENDDGFYKWIKRPAYGHDHRSLLLTDSTNIFKKLDRDSIDEIVAEVASWYENRIKIPA
jgi:hypothetical protein